MRRSQRGQAGLTLVELMVSLALVSIAVGLTFRIFATSGAALRGQSRVSNLQQTLRSGKQLLARELRMAGYMSSLMITRVDPTQGGYAGGGSPFMYPAAPTQIGFWMRPMAINNSSIGPDSFRVAYADPSRCSARVPFDQDWNPVQTNLDEAGCFVTGDLVVAVLRKDLSAALPAGSACVLRITGVNGPIVQHGSAGAPWNSSVNEQCQHLGVAWKKGYTTFYHLTIRAYRVKPADNRGVLQVSNSGGLVANDWIDVALGISDVQLAVRQGVDQEPLPPLPLDGIVDTFSWLSGDNMEGPLTGADPVVAVTAVTLSLVGRAATDGPGSALTPNLNGGDSDTAGTNSLGDRDAEDPYDVTDRASPMFGNNLFRSLTTMVDLRNMGTSAVEL